MAEEEPRCPVHPEVHLRRGHGLIELGDGQRWIAPVSDCPIRGCLHRRHRAWVEPTARQRKNWDELRKHPSVRFVETWPSDILDPEAPPPPRRRLAIELRPLEELPWRRWVNLAPTEFVFPRNGRFHRSNCRSLVGGSEPRLTLQEAAVRHRMVPCNNCFTLRDPDPLHPGDAVDEHGFSVGKPWSRNR